MKAHFLPEGDHILLLKAAFEPDRVVAAQHWLRWREQNTLDACEHRLHRLLPLIYRRLEKAPIDNADLAILRGVYRYNWTRNQLLARSAAESILALQNAAVDVLVLKGMALAHVGYADIGARPMQDFDILIKPEQRPLALQVLAQQGWKPTYPVPDVSAQHACELKNELGHLLDLHWYSNSQCCWPEIDRDFWLRSQPFKLQGVLTRTLAPGDLLLQVCLHAAKDGVEPVGWPADAIVLLHQSPDLSAFLQEACQRRSVLSLHLTLHHLREALKAPVPEWLLQQLRNTPVPWIDRLYYWCKIRGGWSWSFWLTPLLEYWRGERRGFLHFLRRRWGLQRIRQIPGQALKRACQKGDF